jgi:hypothetical protein
MVLSKRILGGLACIAFLTAGCGGREIYPVRGQLVDPDGQPITGMEGAAVEFECVDAGSSANGTVNNDGTFTLTTEKAGDGAHLGKHRISIQRKYLGPEQQAPHVIDPKYENIDTSGLEYVVEAKNNDVKLTVQRYKGKGR